MLIAYYMHGNFIDEKKFIHLVQYAVAVIYLIPVVYIVRVINLSFITQVMLYQNLMPELLLIQPVASTLHFNKEIDHSNSYTSHVNPGLFPTFDIVEIHMRSQYSSSVDAKITSIF